MNVSTMNKAQLRAECKKVGIKNYSKLTVGGMRDALVQRDTTLLADVFPAPAAKAALPPTPERKAAQAPKEAAAPKPEREERNGVKRPIRGVCADVWAALDALRAKGETDLTTAIRAVGEKRTWNKNNIGCELSSYRRFHGMMRPTKS